MAKIRVAVIGAGAAGLCAARYLAAKQDLFEPVVYEQTGRVGGTWVYVEEKGQDKHGLPIHSSMYQNLRTNLPKEVMAFPDFPIKDTLPSFIGHRDVLEYLEEYANHFDLLKHIQFWTSVEKVSPIKGKGRDQWVVEVQHHADHGRPVESNIFDSVIVCNGHYSVPHTPDIPGLQTFSGHYLHSHDYRHPDCYKDQVVAVLGAGPSGVDLALDVATAARRVLLCHWKNRLATELPHNVEQAAAVICIENGNVAVTGAGTRHQVDAILACTGYEYTFPFLSPECQVTIRNKHILELYMHLFHMRYPSLSFIGIPYRILPFPQFALQVQLVLGVLEGRITLPTREEMEAEEKDNLKKLLQKEGGKEKLSHYLGPLQWSYNRLLAQTGHISDLPPVIESLYDEVSIHRHSRVMDYKNMNYRLIGSDSWERMEDSVKNCIAPDKACNGPKSVPPVPPE